MLPGPSGVGGTARTRDTGRWSSSRRGSRFAFDPGQFTMLYAFGIGEAAISISGDPAAGGRRAHGARVGPVTHAICASPGDVIGVRGPFGRPWPVEDGEGRDCVIVAGGIGLAPLRPALLRARRPGALRAGVAPLRRPHARGPALPRELERLAPRRATST